MAMKHSGVFNGSALVICAMVVGMASAEARETGRAGDASLRDGGRIATPVSSREGGVKLAQGVTKVINDANPEAATEKPDENEAEGGAAGQTSNVPAEAVEAPEPAASPEPEPVTEHSQSAVEPAAGPQPEPPARADVPSSPVETQRAVAPSFASPAPAPAADIPGPGKIECFAGCPDAPRRAASPKTARRNPVASPAGAPAETFPEINGGVVCVAGCGNARPTRSSGPARTTDYVMSKTPQERGAGELRPTATDGSDRVLVRRGANGQRIQGINP